MYSISDTFTIILDGTRYRNNNQVLLNGLKLDPAESQKIRNHSPDGFNWGYQGSGPAQLALAICIELYGVEVAKGIYQRFKSRYIATLPQEDFAKQITIAPFSDPYALYDSGKVPRL